MIIGATVLAGLVLLLLVSERGSSRLWQNGTATAWFYCRPCDLRYQRGELRDQVDRVCPRGHCVDALPREFSMSTMLICACSVFIAGGLLLVVSGAAR